ncbi:hypothetical protein [Streptomyces sp. NPDC049916]|uniref:hypothetical protein n=1 Tax=Streptomyces sp. NPDC049916 TaxID=3155156 RepID=UPI003424B8D9
MFTNEFAYLKRGASDRLCTDNAQSIMNWMTFQGSPTWFWLHALKPVGNSEASGCSAGFRRPLHEPDFSRFPGHWMYNPQNETASRAS